MRNPLPSSVHAKGDMGKLRMTVAEESMLEENTLETEEEEQERRKQKQHLHPVVVVVPLQT